MPAAAGVTATTELVSKSSSGIRPTNGASVNPAVSADGRYVAFFSSAALGDAPWTSGPLGWAVYVHDREDGSTQRTPVELPENGYTRCCASISADGRYVAMEVNSGKEEGPAQEVAVVDRELPETHRIEGLLGGTPNGPLSSPVISDDGRYVAFIGGASNLVPGDDNGYPDVFVHDTETNLTTLVSKSSLGNLSDGYSGNPGISGDGRFVAFSSEASNLITKEPPDGTHIYVHDLQTGSTTLAGRTSRGKPATSSYESHLSRTGRYLAFVSHSTQVVADDTNDVPDVFLRDLQARTTKRVSIGRDMTQGNGVSGEDSDSSTLVIT